VAAATQVDIYLQKNMTGRVLLLAVVSNPAFSSSSSNCFCSCSLPQSSARVMIWNDFSVCFF